MKVLRCRKCGRIITREYWYRWRGSKLLGEPVEREIYCAKCANTLVDEHTTGGLLWAML